MSEPVTADEEARDPATADDIAQAGEDAGNPALPEEGSRVDADAPADVDADVDANAAAADAELEADSELAANPELEAAPESEADVVPAGEVLPLVHVIEAALLVSPEPLTVERLQLLFGGDAPPKEALQAALVTVSERCADRAYELIRVASGYRFQVRQSLAPWMGRLYSERPARYSRALLETLALVAYRQPVTRGDIEEVRGVAVSTGIMRTLLERSWIHVVGYRDVPGRPALYGTTKAFLDYFNLTTLEQLPPLSEVRDLDQAGRELELALGLDPSPDDAVRAAGGAALASGARDGPSLVASLAPPEAQPDASADPEAQPDPTDDTAKDADTNTHEADDASGSMPTAAADDATEAR